MGRLVPSDLLLRLPLLDRSLPPDPALLSLLPDLPGLLLQLLLLLPPGPALLPLQPGLLLRLPLSVPSDLLLRQYMHNTEIAVTMRLSTILKTIKQPL